MEIAFYVDGTPVAKPRMTRRDQFFPRPVTSAYWGWVDLIKYAFLSEVSYEQRAILPVRNTPWTLTCHFRLPYPESWPERKRSLVLKECLAHTSAPDLKNLVAGVEDSLNRLIWHDDSQIVAWGPSTKVWAATSGVAIVAETIEPREVYQLSRKYGNPAPIALVKEDSEGTMKR